MADPQMLQLLAAHLDQTLSTDAAVRTKATDEIRSLEGRPGSSLLLLSLITADSFSLQTRQAAAITFKNLVMAHWDDEPSPSSLLPPADRSTIKQHLPRLMLSSPPSIQQQLSQVLAIISQSDFPAQWPSLLPDLTSQLMSPTSSHDTIVGCLSTLHSIFFRYRHEYPSDPLFVEIKYALEMVVVPLTTLFTSLSTSLIAASPDTLTPLQRQQFEQLHLVLDLFLSLNSQDIPEQFEDRIADYFTPFQALLRLPTPEPDMATSDQESEVDKVKALILDIVTLYATRYEEYFTQYMGSFVDIVWNLLTRLPSSSTYDHLVSTSIRFLTCVISQPRNKQLFNSADALMTVIQRVIVPQIKLRDADVEVFSDDPVEWVRRDIEGSDVDTRRRVTVDFIRGLLVNFDREVTELMKGYVGELIASYTAAPTSKWKDKDAAIYIILALSSKSATRARGVTQTNPYIDLSSFFSTQIIPELQSTTSASPILQADAIRFIAAFRSQLSLQQLLTLFPLLIQSLSSSYYVVHTYAAYAIERVLSLRTDSGVAIVSKADFAPFTQPALVALFSCMQQHAESRENEYLMKCVLRVISLSEELILPYISLLIDRLTAILLLVSQNPTHPNFNHAVFDTYAALIVNICRSSPSSVDAFERALFPVFQTILTSDTAQEFSPYVFQILALLLERRGDVSAPYQSIYPSLLDLSLYDNPGNVPALIRLLSAYARRSKTTATFNVQLVRVLAIYQKLLGHRKQHLLAMDLLIVLTDSLVWTEMEQYVAGLFTQLFVKFQNKPGPLFYARAVVFFSVFILRYGAVQWCKSMEGIQGGIVQMVLSNIILSNLSSVTPLNERKAVTVALSELLTSNVLLPLTAAALIPELVVGLIDLVNRPTVLITEVNGEEGEEETPVTGEQSTFSKLAHAQVQQLQYTGVGDAKVVLSNALRDMAKAGALDRFDFSARKRVQDFMTDSGVTG